MNEEATQSDTATRIVMMLGERLRRAERDEAAAIGGAYAEAFSLLDDAQRNCVTGYMERICGAHDRTPQIIDLAAALGARR